jgi:adenosine deaminase
MEALQNEKKLAELYEECISMPKIELHAHIGGSIWPNTFLEMCMNKGIDTDHIDFYHVDYKAAFEIFKIVA